MLAGCQVADVAYYEQLIEHFRIVGFDAPPCGKCVTVVRWVRAHVAHRPRWQCKRRVKQWWECMPCTYECARLQQTRPTAANLLTNISCVDVSESLSLS